MAMPKNEAPNRLEFEKIPANQAFSGRKHGQKRYFSVPKMHFLTGIEQKMDKKERNLGKNVEVNAPNRLFADCTWYREIVWVLRPRFSWTRICDNLCNQGD